MGFILGSHGTIYINKSDIPHQQKKGQNHIIILLIKQEFDKISHQFKDENPYESEIWGTSPNIIKGIYDKLQIQNHGKKLKAFLIK